MVAGYAGTVVTNLDTQALERLLADGAQLIDALPTSEFDEEHLPGAISLPLTDLTAKAIAEAGLDRSAATITYCYDYQCDLSPRAAHRLESLGFSDVYDYVPGIAAWLAEGHPSEGRRRPEQRVSAIARADWPTVPTSATVGDAASVFGDADAADAADVAVVLSPGAIVLGVLRREVLGLDPGTPVGDVLQPGPSTFRPSMTIKELIASFEKSGESRAIVSKLDGEWIGLIRRSDVLDHV